MKVPNSTGGASRLRRTTRVSVGPKGQQANGGSYDSVVSANGRFVALVSVATILVPHGTNGNIHVFIRDRGTDKTEPMSVEKPRLSGASAK